MFSSTNIASSENFLNDMIGGAAPPIDMIKFLVIYIFILYSPLYSPKVKESIEHLFNNTASRVIWTFALFWALCGCIQSALILTVIAQILLHVSTDTDDYPILDYEYPTNVVPHSQHENVGHPVIHNQSPQKQDNATCNHQPRPGAATAHPAAHSAAHSAAHPAAHSAAHPAAHSAAHPAPHNLSGQHPGIAHQPVAVSASNAEQFASV